MINPRLRLAALASALIVVTPWRVAAQSAPAPAATPDRPQVAPTLATGTGAGPNGATLRCRDGSYPAPGAPDSACEGKGGVLVRFPARPQRPAEVSAQAPTGRGAAPIAEPVRDTTRPDGAKTYAERQAEARAAQKPVQKPAGATLLCNDGSYVVRDTASVRCQDRGGVRLRFVAPRTP